MSQAITQHGISARARRFHPTGFDAVRIPLGVVLLIAAILKAQELTFRPVVETSPLTLTWLLMAVVEIEILLGVWLLAGFFPRALRWAALAWFTLLLCVSIWRAATRCRTPWRRSRSALFAAQPRDRDGQTCRRRNQLCVP